MGERISQCVELVGAFCGAGVEIGGLENLHIFTSSSIWLAFVYAMMIMILIMHTTVLPVGGGR